MTSASDKISAIGIMSGTSLDGVDICATEFWKEDSQWNFKILTAQTFVYTSEIYQLLKGVHEETGYNLQVLHVTYGKYLGNIVTRFIQKNNITPDFIASHGHTVFHEPEKGLTFQLGSGAEIAATTGIKTICDFRTTDVALGGQGAPLVPIGDELLFGQYMACLNLGGFANISYKMEGKRFAFDICPVNFILNYQVGKLGKDYDENGILGQKGEIIDTLLNKLDKLEYYQQKPPKSLGREFVEKNIFNLLKSEYNGRDILRTFYQHIVTRVASVLNNLPPGKVLITGGGVHNKFLMELIKQKVKTEIIVPEKKLVDFKEALIFAFLGVLRLQGKNNSLSSATGAKRDNVGGAVYL